jgi:hypothetical protein
VTKKRTTGAGAPATGNKERNGSSTDTKSAVTAAAEEEEVAASPLAATLGPGGKEKGCEGRKGKRTEDVREGSRHALQHETWHNNDMSSTTKTCASVP